MSLIVTKSGRCIATLIVSLAGILPMQQGQAAPAWVDSASVETGAKSKVRLLRVGIASAWGNQWFHSNGTHVGGYWDLSLAHWRGNAFGNVVGQHQSLNSLGLTPVFRFQSDDRQGWYAEGGIGIHFLSERYDNDGNQLSTLFQFGDHLGAGYVFANKWELGAKIQHFSNGGIKKPNSGENLLVFKLVRPF